jgi:membrane-anchored protein YejM (alkaline phosphatase superfamily)
MVRPLGIESTELVRLHHLLPQPWQSEDAEPVASVQGMNSLAQQIFSEERTAAPLAPALQPASDRLGRDSRPNVILIVLESFRADAVNPELMPRLWRLSQRGTRFTQHRSNGVLSHTGLHALMLGRYPLELPPDRSIRGIAGALRDKGYENHAVLTSADEWFGMARFLGRPNFIVHDQKVGEQWLRDVRGSQRAQELLQQSHAPKFIVFYPTSSHFPYFPPREYESYQPSEAQLNLQSRLPIATDGQRKLRQRRTKLLTRFLRCARFLDDLTADWLETVDLERNLVIITGDHGESFGDDGLFTHGSRLSDAQTRVPLIVLGPGVPEAEVRDDITEHVDIAPSILHLLGMGIDRELGLVGRLLFSPEPPDVDFASLVLHKKVALVSERHRFVVRFGRRGRTVQFKERQDHQGRAIHGEATLEEEEVFENWFGDFLSRVARSAPAAHGQRRARSKSLHRSQESPP